MKETRRSEIAGAIIGRYPETSGNVDLPEAPRAPAGFSPFDANTTFAATRVLRE